jgi:hypothetical protein
MFDVANTEIASTCLFAREVFNTFAYQADAGDFAEVGSGRVRTW